MKLCGSGLKVIILSKLSSNMLLYIALHTGNTDFNIYSRHVFLEHSHTYYTNSTQPKLFIILYYSSYILTCTYTYTSCLHVLHVDLCTYMYTCIINMYIERESKAFWKGLDIKYKRFQEVLTWLM